MSDETVGTETSTRVLIADDHPVVRAGLLAILSTCAGYRVVAEAHDGESAWAALRAHEPELAILDVRMPRMSGLDVVARARREHVETAFVLLTMVADGAEFERAMDLEVEAYLVKGSPVEEIRSALDSVRRGHRVVPSPEARRAMGYVAPSFGGDDLDRALQLLTPTERVVLRHLAENKTSRQIATELGVSVRTVQNHRANVCDKLAFRGANKLLQFALEHRSAFVGSP